MKKIFLTMFFLTITLFLFAQTPQTFKYQAVVRDNAGEIIENQPVKFRISIRIGSAGGAIVYRETHPVTTNGFGLANLNIGEGTPISGTFISIDWGTATKFLEVELDPLGGNSYISMGTTQLISVPYALYSENTANTDDADADPANELNTSVILNGTDLKVTDAGGTIITDLTTLQEDADADPTNELNTDINLDGNSLELTDAGGTLVVDLGTLSGDSDWTISGDDMYSGVSGNVGIGTSSPSAPLEVSGRISQINTGYSVFIGEDAGINDDLNDNSNAFIGFKAGFTNIDGKGNVGIGRNSLYNNTQGDYNTALGGFSAINNTTGENNTAVGVSSLNDNTIGSNNTSVGKNAQYSNISGDFNTSVGCESLFYNKTGYNNTVIGYQAGMGALIQSFSGSVLIGYQAGLNEFTDNRLYIENSSSDSPLIYGEFDNDILAVNGKLGIGTHTPSAPLEVSGRISQINTGNSVFLGEGAGINDDLSGNDNTFIGSRAGQNNTTGSDNSAIGESALYSNVSGIQNSALGYYSLYASSTGQYNVAVGAFALRNNMHGSGNVGIGNAVNFWNTTGSNNTAIGYEAGKGQIGNSINGCIFIGYQAGYNNNLDNKLYIENSDSDTPLIYGEFDNNIVSINGRLGVGTETPGAELEVFNASGQVDFRITRPSSSVAAVISFYTASTQEWSLNTASGSENMLFDRGIGNTTGNLALMSTGGNVGIGTSSPSVKALVVGGTDASIGGGGYLITGSTTGQNIVLDENEIMARNNGGTSSLQLQRDGGSLSVHYGLGEINEFRILDDGKTGIGESGPSAKLHLNTTTGEDAMRVQTVGLTKFKIASNGSVAVGYNPSTPTYALQLQNSSTFLMGRGLAYGWSTYSDNRLKSNQKELEYGLKEVMQMQPKSYNHHSSSTNEEGDFIMVTDQKIPTFGFIAQEVQQIIPEAVNEPEDASKNLWSMDYDKLIPVLTKAIQEQQAMIEAMQLEIEALKNQSKQTSKLTN
ncbi:MAG: hypothetical protein DRJ05_07920 [Bacteroidetes bacterium]|nr:MAG: hypothetical protein DRJ05_07920 [Bacteroidota bacterium]